MPLAKDVVAIQVNFIHLLQHIPGTKEEKQAYFRSRSIQVPRTNYDSMWAALATRLHCSGAASAVFELLRKKIPGRVSTLLRTAKRGKPVSLLVSDPMMVTISFLKTESCANSANSICKTSKIAALRWGEARPKKPL